MSEQHKLVHERLPLTYRLVCRAAVANGNTDEAWAEAREAWKELSELIADADFDPDEQVYFHMTKKPIATLVGGTWVPTEHASTLDLKLIESWRADRGCAQRAPGAPRRSGGSGDGAHHTHVRPRPAQLHPDGVGCAQRSRRCPRCCG